MKTNIKLNYRVIGEGYPVVFLHGFLESNTMWDSIIPKLTGRKAVLIELPGHGKSPFYPYGEDMTIRNMSEDVNEVLHALFIEKFSIVGHSLGGYVALDLKSIDENDSVEKIVLLNSHPWSDSESKKKERTRVVNIVDHNKLLFLNEAIPNLFRNPVEYKNEVKLQLEEAVRMSEVAIIQSLVSMRDRRDAMKVMKELGQKCLVIQGKFDHLISYLEMEVFTEKHNNQYFLVEDAGHMAHIESEEEVVKKLLEFI
jgi:2-succinyl-6-hydroxy-2,4-cyclohexadiene-1-carboxylate synthase